MTRKFSFKSYSDAELESFNSFELLPEGEYEFKVLEIEQKISMTGNEMLKVKLQVLQPGMPHARVITDNIVMIDAFAFKYKHFCQAIGLSKEYESSEIDLDHCIGRSGNLIIGVQKGKNKPDGSGRFSDQNTVKDYLVIKMSPELENIFDNNKDIPF